MQHTGNSRCCPIYRIYHSFYKHFNGVCYKFPQKQITGFFEGTKQNVKVLRYVKLPLRSLTKCVLYCTLFYSKAHQQHRLSRTPHAPHFLAIYVSLHNNFIALALEFCSHPNIYESKSFLTLNEEGEEGVGEMYAQLCGRVYFAWIAFKANIRRHCCRHNTM